MNAVVALVERKTGIDPKWNSDFPWMAVAEEGEGMLCSLQKT